MPAPPVLTLNQPLQQPLRPLQLADRVRSRSGPQQQRLLLVLQAKRRCQVVQCPAVCRQQLGVLSQQLLQGHGVAAGCLRMQLLQLQWRQVQAELLQLLRCGNARQLFPGSCRSRQQREALLCLQASRHR